MSPRNLDHVAEISQRSEVSGWSVIWALFAVVTHCMLQPSFTGYFWNSTAFEGSLSPHRSSPVICLVDTAVDVYLALRDRSDSPSTENKPSKNGVLTRLALFVLGVLPQSLKIFSMRGIPITQAVVGAFFLSSLASLVCSLMMMSHQERVHDFASGLEGPGLRSPRARASLIGLVVYVGHSVGVLLVFHLHKEVIGFNAPEDVKTAFKWVIFAGNVVCAAHMIQHAAFIVVGKRSPIPHMPILLLLVVTDYLCLNHLLAPTDKSLPSSNAGPFATTIHLMTTLSTACYLAALGLQYAGQAIHARYIQQGRTSEADASTEMEQAPTPAAEPVALNVADSTDEVVPEQGDTAHQEIAVSGSETAAITPSLMLLRLMIWSLIILGRLLLGLGGPFGHMFNWVELHVKKHYPLRIPIMAFAIMNFTTAAIYYLAFFDPHGTQAPAWSQALG